MTEQSSYDLTVVSISPLVRDGYRWVVGCDVHSNETVNLVVRASQLDGIDAGQTYRFLQDGTYSSSPTVPRITARPEQLDISADSTAAAKVAEEFQVALRREAIARDPFGVFVSGAPMILRRIESPQRSSGSDSPAFTDSLRRTGLFV
jgi:hypothetical protein